MGSRTNLDPLKMDMPLEKIKQTGSDLPIDSGMFGKNDPETDEYLPPDLELVRLAFPRRVYTQSHFDYVLEVIEEVYQNRKNLGGFKFTFQAPLLRHFTAQFEIVQ